MIFSLPYPQLQSRGEQSHDRKRQPPDRYPAFYSRWFFNRLREGYVLVRNPAAPRRISRISLGPEDVDGIVFWTKNPAPMLDKLDLLREYTYYFQFTLTPYGREVESGLPSKIG